MAFRPTDLRRIPLFADIPDEHLDKLVAAFESRALGEGEVLFEAGSVADRLLLLVEGRIEVRRSGPGEAERLTVRAVAPVGELGALAGLRRATTAVAAEPSRVLVLPTSDLLGFFERHGGIGMRFHHNFTGILGDKIVRDRARLSQVEDNVVRTQKVLKRLREALLPAEDSPLHRMMFEELDALIENNRRGHYLVTVPRALPTYLRISDGDVGAEREVLRMSNERLDVAPGRGALPPPGGEFTAVLKLPDGELPVSGTVDSLEGDRTVLALDLLIDDYAAALERHLVKLQLLDVVL